MVSQQTESKHTENAKKSSTIVFNESKWHLHCWPFDKSPYLSELFNILFAFLTVGVRIGFVLLLKFGSAVGALDHRIRTTTVLTDDEWDDQLDGGGMGIEEKLESHKMPQWTEAALMQRSV